MRRVVVTVLVVAAILLGVLAVGASRIWRQLDEPYLAGRQRPVTLLIEQGLPAGRILERLEAEGIVRSAFWSRLYLVHYLGDPSLKAGEYRFEPPLSARQVIDTLVAGDVVTHPVTLIEGMDIFEVVDHLVAEGFGERAAFTALVESPELVADLDPEADDLEGYLFPDTYAFQRQTPEREIVAKLVATFRQHWEDEIAPHLAGDPPPIVRQVVTLASIVEKETSLDSERPIVAGVYTNRLRRGMGLFADPTVIYALKLAGSWDGNLRRADLETDSPYNTYRYGGLPPGPICSPGLASLLAAAEPAEVPYLYFVSRNDGSHVFSRSLKEHNRNVEIWQKRYWRERWARERAAEQQDAGGDDH